MIPLNLTSCGCVGTGPWQGEEAPANVRGPTGYRSRAQGPLGEASSSGKGEGRGPHEEGLSASSLLSQDTVAGQPEQVSLPHSPAGRGEPWSRPEQVREGHPLFLPHVACWVPDPCGTPAPPPTHTLSTCAGQAALNKLLLCARPLEVLRP